MSFSKAKHEFAAAIDAAKSANNPAAEALAVGLAELASTLAGELAAIKRKQDDIEELIRRRS